MAFRRKRFNLSLFLLAFSTLFVGSRILFNIPYIALYTGPEFVFWSVKPVGSRSA